LGQMVKTGSGTLILASTNRINNATTAAMVLLEGTLVVTNTGTLGSSSPTADSFFAMNDGVLDLGTTTQVVNRFGINAGTVSNGTISNSGTYNLVGGGAISANLTGAAANLSKTGAGTVTLSGANTYGGGTAISEGSLVIAQSNFTGTITAASITVQLSSTPATGAAFQILPGSLAGSYPAPSVTPLAAGQTASFDLATGVLSITAAGGSYDSWASGYGLDPATDGAPAADPDGDGFSNNSEFAFGTVPTTATPALLSTSTSGGNLTVSWMERDSELEYTVQSTTSLTVDFAADPSILPATSGSQVGVPAGYTRKQFTVSASGKKFFRVRATGN
jgi:autotransporter-associated beta strand protein